MPLPASWVVEVAAISLGLTMVANSSRRKRRTACAVALGVEGTASRLRYCSRLPAPLASH